jgi:hypothetical protein
MQVCYVSSKQILGRSTHVIQMPFCELVHFISIYWRYNSIEFVTIVGYINTVTVFLDMMDNVQKI